MVFLTYKMAHSPLCRSLKDELSKSESDTPANVYKIKNSFFNLLCNPGVGYHKSLVSTFDNLLIRCNLGKH